MTSHKTLLKKLNVCPEHSRRAATVFFFCLATLLQRRLSLAIVLLRKAYCSQQSCFLFRLLNGTVRPGSFSAFVGVGAGSLGRWIEEASGALAEKRSNFSSSPFLGRKGTCWDNYVFRDTPEIRCMVGSSLFFGTLRGVLAREE